jgi:hypothetical protein
MATNRALFLMLIDATHHLIGEEPNLSCHETWVPIYTPCNNYINAVYVYKNTKLKFIKPISMRVTLRVS